jgi:hypothetical protein
MSSNDPWGEEPQSVAAQAAPKQSYDAEKYPAAEIVQTVKLGSGYADPWLVVHGPDAATVNAIVNTTEYRDLIDTTVKISRYAQRAYAGTTSAAPAAANTAPKAQPDHTVAPSGETKYCEHGARSYKEGVSKAGKTYKGFFCSSADKDNQCAPEWVK